jgi:hypothetical protein
MCPILQKLEMAVRSGDAERHYRHFVRRTHLESTDCAEDDAFLDFADQAVVEAEIRATEARFTLDEHTTVCRFCSMATRTDRFVCSFSHPDFARKPCSQLH